MVDIRYILLALCLVGTLCAQKVQTKSISVGSFEKIYEDTSKDGLAYWYHVPKGLKADTPVNLTFILHGSNLSRGWGFSNHSPKSFRTDDVIVCPDGTSSNGRGGFNFLQSKKDLERLHDLHDELRKIFNIRATYIYGHSQGSFFALYYAGAYPKDVQGVVAHASGMWIGTEHGKKGHDQAIVLMHGTADPVVPYGQSLGAYDVLAKAKYPMLRLRSLEGWNHWPAEHNGPVPHTSQQLAWAEGMTTEDPKRMEWCFDFLAKVKDKSEHDFDALHSLASALAEREKIPGGLKRKAAKSLKSVEALASKHANAIRKSLGKKGGKELDGKPWVGHLSLFLRQFSGTTAAADLSKELKKILDAHEKQGSKSVKEFWKQRRKEKVAKAFDAGLDALSEAPLYRGSTDPDLLKLLEGWAKDSKTHKLSKKKVAAFEKAHDLLMKGLKSGKKAFQALNRKF